jgi:hypothetical protein
MKRLLPLILVVLLALTACGSDLIKSVYTASGDSGDPDELSKTKTSVFRPNDDLNVVINLGAHRSSRDFHAVFNAPDGSVYATEAVTADETTSAVVLGLDWATRNGTMWPTGVWSVDLFVGDKKEKTVEFSVTDTAG